MTAIGPGRDRTTTAPEARPAPAEPPGAGDPTAWTRFAPAPTGFLHLGHVANAIWVWGLATLTTSRVLLRIEDHDRERSRPAFDAAIIEDLEWLGFRPDAGPVRQRGDPEPYEAALALLRMHGLVYACDCTRAMVAAWTRAHGSSWRGGCPGDCRERRLADDDHVALRVTLGPGDEGWDDRVLGPRAGQPSAAGDPAIRDRHGNWTYAFAVVVDDLRQDVTLVVRGEDLVDATPAQIRLARRLGRREPPVFAHHPLIRKPGGAKLSKSGNDTGVRELRALGWGAPEVIGAAALAVGLLAVPRPVEAVAAPALIKAALDRS